MQSRSRTRPFWLSAGSRSEVDAAVVGGGMTGVAIAYFLALLGYTVRVFEERGSFALGASGRNGGHLSPGPLEISGADHERAREVLRFEHQTVRQIQEFVDQEGIRCDLRFGGHVRLAGSEEEFEALKGSAQLLQEEGYPVELWGAEEVERKLKSYPGVFAGGLFNPAGAQWNPAAFTYALAERAEEAGAVFHFRTRVLRVEQAQSGFHVMTSAGVFPAKRVVYANNAWAGRLGVERITPVRGQALVTEPAPSMWDFGASTVPGAAAYWLQLPNGKIVLGGLRSLSPSKEVGEFNEEQLHPAVSAGLRSFLRHHFPALQDLQIEAEWTGIMGFSPDGNPLVGELQPGVWILGGYSGHGMPVILSAAEALAALIAGKEPQIPIPQAYRPDRF
ncbi:MAG: FAD-dependent oxidoreductase [Candidatus Yanofskybacteria bacterium]|nr:FAD-dependent oxidoreductase [Candidatus Yanofskybacteria bacterium]